MSIFILFQFAQLIVPYLDRLPDILDFSIADFPEKHKEEQRQSPLPNHSLKRPKKGSHHKNW